MSSKINEIIGQHLIIGIQDKILKDDEKKFIVENNIGGVILFERNYESLDQLHDLCTSIKSLRHNMVDKLPLFISVDMEGGRVQRFKEPFTKWPALKYLGDLNSSVIAFNFAYLMGLELQAVGINLNFAPCLDILTNPQNEVIGDRAISNNVEVVNEISSALVRGYIKSKIISCAKHFPGHGNTLLDSHQALPIEGNISEADLFNREIQPFKRAFKARMDMVMTAHIKFPVVDDQWPVTLSKKFIQNIIREKIKYRGLIISDDLDMKALTNNYDREDIAVNSLNAGINILLYCNEPSSPFIAIESIIKAWEEKKINLNILEENYQKILYVKNKKLADLNLLNKIEAENIIGCKKHQLFAKAIIEGKGFEDLLD